VAIQVSLAFQASAAFPVYQASLETAALVVILGILAQVLVAILATAVSQATAVCRVHQLPLKAKSLP
jgi:hypothetical protein